MTTQKCCCGVLFRGNLPNVIVQIKPSSRARATASVRRRTYAKFLVDEAIMSFDRIKRNKQAFG